VEGADAHTISPVTTLPPNGREIVRHFRHQFDVTLDDLPMLSTERLLVAFNLATCLIQGARHESGWLVVPLLVFTLYLVLEDRALRRRIGPRSWPSEGYARFAFNTNLFFVLTQLTAGAALFALASALSPVLGL
jgi:hypothetical protein